MTQQKAVVVAQGDGRSKKVSAGMMLGILGAIVAVGLVAYALGAFDSNGDEDRPPIVVKNGSIIFGTERNWVSDGVRKWKPDHKRGKWTPGFDVSFTGVTCQNMSDNPVTIRRTTAAGEKEVYEVKASGWFRKDPKVTAPVDMDVDNTPSMKTLTSRDTGGEITEVEVGTGGSATKCSMPSGSKPEIWIQPR